MNIEPLYSTRLSLKIVQINYNVCFKKSEYRHDEDYIQEVSQLIIYFNQSVNI